MKRTLKIERNHIIWTFKDVTKYGYKYYGTYDPIKNKSQEEKQNDI